MRSLHLFCMHDNSLPSHNWNLPMNCPLLVTTECLSFQYRTLLVSTSKYWFFKFFLLCLSIFFLASLPVNKKEISPIFLILLFISSTYPVCAIQVHVARFYKVLERYIQALRRAVSTIPSSEHSKQLITNQQMSHLYYHLLPQCVEFWTTFPASPNSSNESLCVYHLTLYLSIINLLLLMVMHLHCYSGEHKVML